jgi:hypothetical protein
MIQIYCGFPQPLQMPEYYFKLGHNSFLLYPTIRPNVIWATDGVIILITNTVFARVQAARLYKPHLDF